jgi:hypothetical protein
VSDWLLDRSFSTSARAGSWSRNEAHRRQRDFLGRHWSTLSLIVIGAGALTPLLLLLPAWSRSFAAGAYLATIVWLLVGFVLLRSGTASLAMGEAAEVWTAEELRRLRRRGWRVMNHVVLGWGDIDHVALGPGGVVVLETKWAAEGWGTVSAVARIEAAVKQVTTNADRVRGFIRPELTDTPIQSALVLWGPRYGVEERTTAHTRVPVLRGLELRTWLDALPSSGVDAKRVEAIWKRIVAQSQRRDANLEQRFGRAPKGVAEYVESVWQIVLGALIGFVVSATTLSWLGWKLDLAAALILVGVGALILRVRRLRPLAFAWIIGTQCVTVLIVGAVVLDWTRHP